MSLPMRRQRRFIGHMELNGFTRKTMAAALGITPIRLNNIISGQTYPSPIELDRMERLFGGMPAQVFFDAELLAYRENWPPPRGMLSQEDVRKINARREAQRRGGEPGE